MLALLKQNTKIYHFRESKLILVSELKPPQNTDAQETIVLSILDEATLTCLKQQKLVLQPRHFRIQKLDNKSKVIFWREHLENQPFIFSVYDVCENLKVD